MPERYLGKSLGKYRVEELIGSGGFAWVYRGFDPELEIPVALKVLKGRKVQPKALKRFFRESQAAAQLNHNNIVQAIDVGEAGDLHRPAPGARGGPLGKFLGLTAEVR